MTLADVPRFFNPRNTEFRNYVIDNIKYNPAVADFWRYEFFERREREQQERIDAALTRVSTLLTHPYIRQIVGQRETTIDFASILANQQIVLLKLSANLTPDIKKFIGTIFISELLYVIRNRPDDKRSQFCIFVDDFHNFLTEDCAFLIAKAGSQSDIFDEIFAEVSGIQEAAGKRGDFGIAATMSHAERSGHFAENQGIRVRRDSWNMTAVTQKCTVCPSLAAAA